MSNDHKILKATEELVTAARLDQIARENKSIGSILDTRILQPLDDIRFQTKKSIKQDVEKRLHGRRGGKGEVEIVSKVSQAVETFKETGEFSTGSYDLEKSIWKEKAKNISYSQRRKFQQPLLHQFYKSMNERQKAEYKQKVGSAFIELAEKYRADCKNMKSEFDLSGKPTNNFTLLTLLICN
jgi:hypothetical protein